MVLWVSTFRSDVNRCTLDLVKIKFLQVWNAVFFSGPSHPPHVGVGCQCLPQSVRLDFAFCSHCNLPVLSKLPQKLSSDAIRSLRWTHLLSQKYQTEIYMLGCQLVLRPIL